MTKEIIRIITTECHSYCMVCNERFVVEDFARMVNHYIGKHEHKLLHIGTETSLGPNDVPWHATVAILGK